MRPNLARLLPLAQRWAEEQAAGILRAGRPLTANEVSLATRVGVRRPERVRIDVVDRIPVPSEPSLKAACEELDILGPDTLALTLGYGVFLRTEVAAYLRALLKFGYEQAPMERDARAAEESG
jgi:hypothetical protein